MVKYELHLFLMTISTYEVISKCITQVYISYKDLSRLINSDAN